MQAAGLALANANAKIHEQGGNNLGDSVQAWQRFAGGVAGESWCNDFCYSMYLKAWCSMKGLLLGKLTDAQSRQIMLDHASEFTSETHIARTGSCQVSFDAAKAQGRAHSKGFDALPGDQVYFDFPVRRKQLGRAHHTGIVLECRTDGTIRTVEGNTSSGIVGPQSDGDGVFMRVRGRDYIYGFAHFA